MSSFRGIETVLRSLRAQQKSLEITQHNIANANTEGYSKQVAKLTATDPYTVPSLVSGTETGQVGTGVKVEQIQRLKDHFVSQRLNNETQKLGEWATKQETLKEIELVFNEPTTNSLRTAFDEFWTSLQELNNAPDSQGVRSAVKEQGDNVAETFRGISTQLKQLQEDVNFNLESKKQDINTLGDKIANLNKQIINVEGVKSQNKANDLKDQRDKLVNDLSRIVNISTTQEERGDLRISIGGTNFISGGEYNEVKTEFANNMNYLKWEHTDEDILINSGELKGMLDMRDEEIPFYLEELDSLARAFVTEINTQHQNGYTLNDETGFAFFDPAFITADTIALSDEIKGNLNNIAAASNPFSPLDGSNALNLAQLKDKLIMNEGNSTFADHYATLISRLGVEGQKANSMTENQHVLIQSIENQQESISGVSLDEEMANIVKTQQAYNAAAKSINTVNQMLDSLMSIIK
ncbi:MAG: flagellar hook-associated protein FlgK [bacterium]